MEVAIVGKTVWGDRRCIGAAALTDGRALRLLPKTFRPGVHASWFHHENTPLKIGGVWAIDGAMSRYARPPHTEDFILNSQSFVREQEDIRAFIVATCPIVDGPISTTFDRTLQVSRDRLLIPVHGRLPDHSTCFWRCDEALPRYDEKGKVRFICGDCTISYVGEQPPGPSFFCIPEKSIVRLSLSRAFTTERHPSAFWLQISDWYAGD